jgi:anti-sigma factor RsiW
MTGTPDPRISERLSAYLDGALSAQDCREVEALVARDPAVASELAALRRVDAALAEGFAEMLARPVPLSLARAIEVVTPMAPPEPHRQPGPAPRAGLLRFRSLAAGLALIAVGAAAGALVTRTLAPVEVAIAPGWLDQIAQYHAVYARQDRHLVEVGADEQAHLERWLSEQTGVSFRVPDLSASGLIFQGGRLVVVNGKPVAQLMYRDGAGQVVALCFLSGDAPARTEGAPVFADRREGAFDLVSWTDSAAAYVVIGPAGRADLRQIAEAAAGLL